MDKDLTKGTPLSHDEKGQLQGGFQLQSSSFESHFFSDNGNCPVKITQQEISVNIKQYFFDLYANFQQTN